MKEEITLQIADIIKDELLQRGILVNFSVEEKKYGIVFISTDFQTMPVLFKRNYIKANMNVGEKNEKGISEIFVSVYLQYEMFEGGENGTKLFDIICGFNNANNRIWKDCVK